MFQTVRRCFSHNDAFRVKLFLESRGIEAFIPDEITSQLAPMVFVHGPGIRVQVKTEDLQTATEEIKDFQA